MKVSNEGRDDVEAARRAEEEKRKAERAARRAADGRVFIAVVQRAKDQATADVRAKDPLAHNVGANERTVDAKSGAADRSRAPSPLRTADEARAPGGTENRSLEANAKGMRSVDTPRRENDAQAAIHREESTGTDSTGGGSSAPREGEVAPRGNSAIHEDSGEESAPGRGDEHPSGDASDDARQPPLESQAAFEMLNARLRPPAFALPAPVDARERRPWPELVVDGIVRAVRFGHFKKRFDVRIELRAGVLGALSFHIASDAGRLSLAFESESDAALDAIRERFANLEEQLSSAGIRFAAVDYRRRSRRAPGRGDGGGAPR